MMEQKTAAESEVIRLQKIIDALIDQIEKMTDDSQTDFGIFQRTVILEDKIRNRTHELETALHRIESYSTELQNAKQRIEQSEELLRLAFTHTPVGMAIIGNDLGFVRVNPSLCAIFGMSEQELLGQSYLTLAHRDDIEKESELFRGLCAGERESFTIEKRCINRDNRERWVKTSVSEIRSQSQFIVQMEDITERIESTQKIVESEKRFRLLADNSVDMIWTVSLEGHYTYVSPSVAKLFGFTQEEVFFRSILDLLKEEAARNILKDIQAELAKPSRERREFFSFETLHYRKDGSLVDVEINASWIYNEEGNIIGVQGSTRDISERKNAEYRLKEQLAFEHSLLNAIPAPVFFKDSSGIYLGVNRAFENFFGAAEDKIVGKNVYGISPRELADVYNAADDALFQNRDHSKVQIYESKVKNRHGDQRDVVFHKAIFEKLDGSVGGLIGAILDITERKETEEALRSNRELLSLAADLASLGPWSFDFNRKYYVLTDEFYSIYATNVEREGATMTPAKYAKEFIHPDDRNIYEQSIADALLLTDSEKSTTQFEYRIIRRDGEVRTIAVKTKVIRNEKGEIVRCFGTNQDITERKRIEENLEKTVREKEMLMHELQHRVKNNLMMVSSLLNLNLPELKDETCRKIFRQAIDRIFSIAAIYQQLYQTESVSTILLAPYLENLVVFMRKTYLAGPERITIVTDLEQSNIDLKRAVPLGLILNELITNAIKHAFAPDECGEIRIKLRRDDHEICINVADNGRGIPEGFDPKQIKSMGIRLVTMLAEQINARVTLDKVKKGTSWGITFNE
jgi:PAS domain S-box-containing protein